MKGRDYWMGSFCLCLGLVWEGLWGFLVSIFMRNFLESFLRFLALYLFHSYFSFSMLPSWFNWLTNILYGINFVLIIQRFPVYRRFYLAIIIINETMFLIKCPNLSYNIYDINSRDEFLTYFENEITFLSLTIFRRLERFYF